MAKAKEETSNKTNIFEETIKAVMITKRLEEEAHREIPDKERLEMVQKARETVRDLQEDEQLEAEEKRLKKSIRFPGDQVFNIPADKKDVVFQNYEREKEEARQILNSKYNRLNELIQHFGEMETLLEDIAQLEDRKKTARWIESILNGEITKIRGHKSFLGPRLINLTQFSVGSSLRELKIEVRNLRMSISKRTKLKGAK